MFRGVIALAVLVAVCHGAAKKKAADPLIYLTDETLEAALSEHPLLLLSLTADGCEPCAQVGRMLRSAGNTLRVKAKGGVTVGQLRLDPTDSPTIARIVQGALTLPKLIIFREGEAIDFVGEYTSESMVSVMLREASRDTIQTLRTVKQAERFLHLDSWSAQHTEEAKPSRVVGFFPSNNSAAYAVYRDAARKLQGLISFGESFDPAITKKFLGRPITKSVIQIVKADKKERKITYEGTLAVAPLARWVATHQVSLVQDLSTESSIEHHMAIGVPVFLLLMPDSYEEDLGEMLPRFRSVAEKVRGKLLFAYGFKDTEPWPQFAQQLGIDRSASGAVWMIVGNGMELTGRDWEMAWLRPPQLGFSVFSLEARNKETPAQVSEEKLQRFVDGFLNQVEQMEKAMGVTREYEGVVEEEILNEIDETAGAAEPAAAARNHDKELRKSIGALEMQFNSGVANLKKALDEIKDTPHLLQGNVPKLTTTLSNMELKVKQQMLALKRQLMEIGRPQKEDL